MWFVHAVSVAPEMILLAAQSRSAMGAAIAAIGGQGCGRDGSRTAACSSRSAPERAAGCFAVAADTDSLSLGRRAESLAALRSVTHIPARGGQEDERDGQISAARVDVVDPRHAVCS
jgi:hypothetical protein